MVFPFDGLQSSHRIGFTGTCLSVYEETGIITPEYILEDGGTGLFKDLLLGGTLIEDGVKVELVNFIFEIEGDAMIDEFKAAFGELIAKRSVPDIDFNLVIVIDLFEEILSLSVHIISILKFIISIITITRSSTTILFFYSVRFVFFR